jgi:outer membrane protein assembly factor BamB
MYVEGQYFRFGIIKFNADGNLDTAFNGTGRKLYTHTRPGDYTSSVTMDDNNNIYITTSNFNKDERIYDVFIRKFNADGTIDTSFGVNGISQQAPEPNKGLLQKVLL